MKRWWNLPPQRPARGPRRRVSRILAPAMMAGALAFSASSQYAEWNGRPSIARTGGAVVAAWAFGTLSSAKQLNYDAACDLAYVCEVVISSNGGAGTGTGATIKNDLATSTQTDPAPNLPFTLTETIDYPHPAIKARGNASQGACYPANAWMTITVDASSTLALDIVGQACQMGLSSDQLVFTGAYVSDAASTGQFANVDGIGSVSISNPSGLESTSQNMKASFFGQLKYTP